MLWLSDPASWGYRPQVSGPDYTTEEVNQVTTAAVSNRQYESLMGWQVEAQRAARRGIPWAQWGVKVRREEAEAGQAQVATAAIAGLAYYAVIDSHVTELSRPEALVLIGRCEEMGEALVRQGVDARVYVMGARTWGSVQADCVGLFGEVFGGRAVRQQTAEGMLALIEAQVNGAAEVC